MFEIFSYDFMIRAFIAGGLVAGVAPVVGIFLVVRRYSLMADTLSHVSLVGVAAALVTGTSPFLGAVAISVIASIGLDYLKQSKKILGDAALALFLSGSLALALILVSTVKGLNAIFINFLFGSITSVTVNDMLIMVALTVFIALILAIFYKQLFAVSFDEEHARASGIRVQFVNAVLMLCTALLISIGLRIVGALLIGALMIIPVIAALQWQVNFRQTAKISTLISLLATSAGLYASFYINLPAGPSIVAASICMCIISMVINKRA